ncbi:MAG: OB-fold tRNA/helicase-type nucleic acid binding [Geobacteraceae bacterium]|nr:MAG: OB-fold tRNA/helicase-type nucleic acid binding [Geobacteraceae bacterium]
MTRLLTLFAAGLMLILPAAGRCADDAVKPVHPPVSSARPAAIPPHEAKPPQEAAPISGRVVQTMNSGGYSYVLVKQKGEEKIWLAIPQTQVVVGEQMTFGGGMEMINFQSKSLNRTFDKIIFSQGPLEQKGTKGEKKGEKKSPGSKGAVIAAGEKIKVEKASGPNAYRVADIYKLKAKLDKKKVAVRGKVVKVSAGIMDRNWIHIQDGSGDPKKATNNLVVTSKALPSVGDIVTASGTLYKDKDFGGGYKYEVIMEKTEIVIQ